MVKHIVPLDAAATLQLITWWLSKIPMEQRAGELPPGFSVSEYSPAFKATSACHSPNYIMLTITAIRVYYSK